MVEISEIALSKDLRNVTIYWLLDDINAQDDVNRRVVEKSNKVNIEKISAWFETVIPKFRFALTSKVSFKVNDMSVYFKTWEMCITLSLLSLSSRSNSTLDSDSLASLLSLSLSSYV
jgi:ribosome-binding factor A